MLRIAALRPLPLAILAAGAVLLAMPAGAQDAEKAKAAAPQGQNSVGAKPSAADDYRLPQPAAEPEEENTRAVRIIDEAPFPPAVAPPPAPVLATPSAGAAPSATYDIGNTELKAQNAAGLSIQIVPGRELQVGNRIVFKVSTKRSGYLLLVDVDANGKLTQIYPNQQSLMALGPRGRSNQIRPGQTVNIPDAGNPLAGFEFVAAPPNGVAMIVAILSERPVQLIDLPDVPPQFAGREAALKYLTDFTRTLRIAGNDDAGALQETQWSFDAKLYVIR